MLDGTWTFPQALTARQEFWLEFWLGGVILLIVVIIAGVGINRYRKRMFGKASQGTDFEVDNLEEMHRSGLISDEEFSRLRRKVLAKAMGMAVAGPKTDAHGAEKAESSLTVPGEDDDLSVKQDDDLSKAQDEPDQDKETE
jgi:hypothetical protein